MGRFLRSRRARLSPEELGVRPFGQRRRVPGLRREELGPLAGIGVDYYTRLEQGRVQNVSVDVLEAIADVLGLNPAEREYVRNLNRPSKLAPPVAPDSVRPALQHLLDSTPETPAYIIGPLTNVLAWNRIACTLFLDFGALSKADRNWAYLLFLHDGIQAMFDDLLKAQRENVAFLRLQTSRYPNADELSSLVDRMLADSPFFRELWEQYEVIDKSHNDYLLHHPVVGDVILNFQAGRLPNEPGQALITFTPEPDTPSAKALHVLAQAN